MRISDWSSDVCSSDLSERTFAEHETRAMVLMSVRLSRALMCKMDERFGTRRDGSPNRSEVGAMEPLDIIFLFLALVGLALTIYFGVRTVRASGKKSTRRSQKQIVKDDAQAIQSGRDTNLNKP